jgi:Flp pilus assembly pilin Flp
MQKLKNLVWSFRISHDTKGQDLIEYALMAGFVAVADPAIAALSNTYLFV